MNTNVGPLYQDVSYIQEQCQPCYLGSEWQQGPPSRSAELTQDFLITYGFIQQSQAFLGGYLGLFLKCHLFYSWF